MSHTFLCVRWHKKIKMSESKENSLKERWSKFFSIILDPWVLLLLVTVLIIFYFYRKNTITDLEIFYTVILALLASVWGGIVGNRWIKVNEEQVIEARGKNAVRSLNLLISSISNIEDRITNFKSHCDCAAPDPQILKSNLEEVHESLKTIKSIGYNSIENWQDILPEADLKSYFLKVQEINLKLSKEKERVEFLETELKNTELDKQKIGTYKTELQSKKDEIFNLRQQLVNCQDDYSTGTTYNQEIVCTCRHCDCDYQPGTEVYIDGVPHCPNCKCNLSS